MADLRTFAATSNLIRFTLKNKLTGQGLTGLSIATSGLIISTICDVESTAVAYTQGGGTLQTIATLGTYVAPSANNCRFKEVDSANHKGLYEFQFADARFAVTNAKRLVISVNDGESTILDSDYEIELTQFSMFSSTVTVGTNNDKTGYSLSQSFPSNFSSLAITGGGAVTAGTVSDKTGYALTQSFPSNFSSLAITGGGAVTAGTVSDKTGYSLTQSFPSNFASLGITAGGHITTTDTVTDGVTVTTNSDKTGYSLTQSFPTNFSSFAITVGGAVTVGTNSDKTGYSLTQSFPSNFASLGITAGGHITTIDTITNGVTVTTNNDKTGYALSSAGMDAVTVETGLNARQAISICSSSLAGVLSGAATSTVTIQAADNDGTPRIVAIVDSNGNRSSVTLTPPS